MPDSGPPIIPGRQPYPPAAPQPSLRQSWWARLSPLPKSLLVIGGLMLGVCLVPVLVVGAISAGIAPPDADRTTQAEREPAPAGLVTTSAADTDAPAVTLPPTMPTPTPAATSTTTTAPPTKVTTKTTTKKPTQPKCDPNYVWACVPIASDVDCAGGSGNGPRYVVGPVKVIGYDIYDLDRDGDGIGCDT